MILVSPAMDVTALPKLLQNPLLTNAISVAVVGSTLTFTNADSRLRLLLLPILLAWTWVILPYSRRGVTRSLYASLLASQWLGICVQYLEMGLLSRWSYAAQGPTSGLGGQHHLRPEKALLNGRARTSRFRYMLDAVSNTRRAGSPWEVKQTPLFSAAAPAWVPSRTQFLRWTALKLGINLFILDLISLAPIDPGSNAVHFAWARVPVFARWGKVTREEIAIRAAATLAGWIVNCVVLEAMYDALAIVSVALGLYEVDAFRPMFGSTKECWSIRQFWGLATFSSME